MPMFCTRPGRALLRVQDGLGGVQAAGEAVLMKTIFEPGPGVVGSLVGGDLIQGRQFCLGVDGWEIKKGMFVVDAAEDFGWIDAVVAVEGNKIVYFLTHALEPVHPVVGGWQYRPVRTGVEPVVPSGPTPRGAGHERGIGVQGSGVRLIGKF